MKNRKKKRALLYMLMFLCTGAVAVFSDFIVLAETDAGVNEKEVEKQEEMTEEALAKHEIIQIRLKEEIPERYVCMVYDRKRPMSAAAQKLKQILDKGESYAEIK